MKNRRWSEPCDVTSVFLPLTVTVSQLTVSSCLSQEGAVDLTPLDSEWNDRRRMQMSTLIGGFKGEDKTLGVWFKIIFQICEVSS